MSFEMPQVQKSVRISSVAVSFLESICGSENNVCVSRVSGGV